MDQINNIPRNPSKGSNSGIFLLLNSILSLTQIINPPLTVSQPNQTLPRVNPHSIIANCTHSKEKGILLCYLQRVLFSHKTTTIHHLTKTGRCFIHSDLPPRNIHKSQRVIQKLLPKQPKGQKSKEGTDRVSPHQLH